MLIAIVDRNNTAYECDWNLIVMTVFYSFVPVFSTLRIL